MCERGWHPFCYGVPLHYGQVHVLQWATGEAAVLTGMKNAEQQ